MSEQFQRLNARAQHYLRRAEEVRTKAAAMQLGTTRDTLEKLADDYDTMAKRAQASAAFLREQAASEPAPEGQPGGQSDRPEASVA